MQGRCERAKASPPPAAVARRSRQCVVTMQERAAFLIAATGAERRLWLEDVYVLRNHTFGSPTAVVSLFGGELVASRLIIRGGSQSAPGLRLSQTRALIEGAAATAGADPERPQLQPTLLPRPPGAHRIRRCPASLRPLERSARLLRSWPPAAPGHGAPGRALRAAWQPSHAAEAWCQRRPVPADSTFAEVSGPLGGALALEDAAVRIIGSTFARCSAEGAPRVPRSGGAIAASASWLEIEACTFVGNSAARCVPSA